MINVPISRHRYAQFFVLLMLSAILYIMVQSIGPGITNFQDNFYKKDFLIENATRLRMKIGDRVFPQVLLGKDGWMEYAGPGNTNDFQNADTFKDKKEFLLELITINQYLNSQGITLLIVVAPNKASIYPDKIPEQIKSFSTESRFDSLISYLEINNFPVVLDLRPALKAARQESDVYYKTDTHWNGYGAFVAYTTIINALGISYPELKPYKSADLELVTTNPAVHDMPNLMQAKFITEPYLFFTLKKPIVQTLHPGNSNGYNQFSSIQNSKLPILLMFHDSFGAAALNDYLSMNFKESHFIHLVEMPQYLTKESIGQFKPDIIIIEIVERNIQKLPYYFAGWKPQ